jgi:hypothetical protein
MNGMSAEKGSEALRWRTRETHLADAVVHVRPSLYSGTLQYRSVIKPLLFTCRQCCNTQNMHLAVVHGKWLYLPYIFKLFSPITLLGMLIHSIVSPQLVVGPRPLFHFLDPIHSW